MKFPIIVVALLCVFITPVLAADSSRQLYDFATSLYDEGNYFGAVLEFERLLDYYPNSPQSGEATYMIGMGYLRAGKNSEAEESFETYISQYPHGPKTSEALTKIAQSYYGTRRFNGGIYKLSGYGSGPLGGLAQYLTGWGYVGTHRFNEGESVFYYLGTRESEFKEKAVGLSEDLKLSNNIQQKSPLLAGILSAVIPGTGQMYAEKYYDGAVSFLLNAVFIYLTAENSRSGNGGTALFFGVIELGWYSSNIYGAVRSADIYNERVKDKFVEGLRIKYGFEF